MWSYIPENTASASTDFPQRLDPAMTVKPAGMPMPTIGSPLGTSMVTFRESSQSNGTASVMGARSSSLLGRMDPTATKDASPILPRLALIWSAFSAVWRWL